MLSRTCIATSKGTQYMGIAYDAKSETSNFLRCTASNNWNSFSCVSNLDLGANSSALIVRRGDVRLMWDWIYACLMGLLSHVLWRMYYMCLICVISYYLCLSMSKLGVNVSFDPDLSPLRNLWETLISVLSVLVPSEMVYTPWIALSIIRKLSHTNHRLH